MRGARSLARFLGLLVGSASLFALSTALAEPELKDVYARFVLRTPGRAAEELVLVRTRDRTEHRFIARGAHEVWRRTARGELEHVKAYPREGKSVHYTAGDLRAIPLLPAWGELSSLVDRALLHARASGPTHKTVHGRRAELLTGVLHGRAAQVAWLPEASLPAEIRFETRGARAALELVELAPCTPERCAPLDERALRSVEFADLGDKEYDPFVRRFLVREARARSLPLHDH